jgi:hypothetical protein
VSDRRTAVGVIAAFYAVLVVCWIVAGGGVAKDLPIHLAVLGIMIVISVPFSWLTYRRLMRRPIVVAAAEPSPAIAARLGLEHTPVTLVAERWKLLVWALYTFAFVVLFVAISLFQPGVCRAVSLASAVALFGWPLVSVVFCLFALPTLTLSSDGLKLKNPWRSQEWRWDEIRDIKVTRPNLRLLGRLSEGIYFRRYHPPGASGGPARAGFRAIWKPVGEELGAILNTARDRWSTSAQSTYVPVPIKWWQYAPVVARLALMATILWLWYGQPC